MFNQSKHPLLYLFLASLLLFLAVALYPKSSQMEYLRPNRKKIVESIYGLGRVKSYKEYSMKVGIAKGVKSVFVHEGTLAKKGDKLLLFDDNTLFRAPFDGTVTSIDVNENETVFAGTILMQLMDLKKRYIEVLLEQQAALRVKVGQKAQVLFESLRGDRWQGNVTAIFPKNNEFVAHIEVDNLSENILPGMSADVSIEVSSRENALVVPLSALDSGTLLIERDGKKMKVNVNIGAIDGEWAEVISGDLQKTDSILFKKD